MKFLIRPIVDNKVLTGCGSQCDRCGNQCWGRFRSAMDCMARCVARCNEFLHI